MKQKPLKLNLRFQPLDFRYIDYNIFYNIEDERWAIIPEFPDFQISTLARFRYLKTGNILYPTMNHRTGRLFKRFWVGKAQFTRGVSKMMKDIFLGPTPEGCQLDHKDDNRANDKLSNLQFLSKSENAKKARKTPRIKELTNWLDPIERYRIRRLWGTKLFSQCDLARRFRCTNGAISRIVNGKRGNKLCPISSIDRTRRQARLEIIKKYMGEGILKPIEMAGKLGCAPNTAYQYMQMTKENK